MLQNCITYAITFFHTFLTFRREAKRHLHNLHQIMEGSNSMLHLNKEVEQRVFIKNDLVASLACDEKARNREAMSHMGRVDIYSQLEKEYSTIHCSA